MFNTRGMRLPNFHVITCATKLAIEGLGRLMSQSCEMEHFAQKKKLMKIVIF